VGDEDPMGPLEELDAPIPSSYTADFSSQGDGVGDADPMASFEALDALVPRSKITPLIKSKSNLEGALQASFHFALLGLAASIPRLSLLAMAFVSSFFFNGLHETVHNSAFRSEFLNNAWAHIFGFLCLRPARHYFYYHWQHHKYTGNTDLDSELQPGSFLDLPIETPLSYLAYISGVPFWVDAVSSIGRHALGDCPEPYLPSDKARREVIWEARTYLALYGVVAVLGAAFGTGALVRLWILPALLGQPFLRFYLLAEHRGRRNSPLIYENTRTMQTNWFYRKLAWSMPFHMEHHAWPSVPFHKLKDAHELLVDAGGQDLLDRGEIDKDLSRNGYISFNFKFLKKLFQSKQGAKT
jgi:fatty acid desaturase